MRTHLLLLGTPLLFGGCLKYGLDGFLDVSLNELRDRKGPVSIFATEAFVSINFDDSVAALDSCVRFNDDITGTLGGVPMEVYPGGADDDGVCLYPRMRLIRPPRAELTDFVISDGESSITCGLGDMLAERGPTLVTPGSWELARGQRVTVQWTPATEFDVNYDLSVALTPAAATPGSPRQVVSSVAAGGIVTLEIPTNVFPGANDLVFSVQQERNYNHPIACSLQPTLSVYTDISQPIRITP